MRTAQGTKTLPGEHHISPAIFAEEQERIFRRRWLYAGRADQLAAPGDYFLYEIAGESLIILRDQDGTVRTFYNVCRHRGSRLCNETHGHLSRAIQCPYHAWSYALDGRLIGAPNMAGVVSFVRDDYPLHPAGLAEWEGCLFVNLSPEPPPFAEAYAPLLGRFSRWRLSELKIAHQVIYDVAANWKLLFQNYSECYHCPTLHPRLNELTPYRDSSNDLEEGPFLGGPMRLAAGVESMTLSGRACAAPLNGDAGRLVYYYTLFPNFFLSLHPDYVLLHALTPLGPSRTRIACHWLFHPDAMAQPGFDPSDAVGFWDMTNRQDWQICERVQQGVSSRAYTPGPYADLESIVAAFDRHYLEVMET